MTMKRATRLPLSLARLKQTTQRAHMRPALAEISARYGLDHMTFLVVRLGNIPNFFPFFCTTYPEEWEEIYLGKGYFDIDPVIDVIRWSLLPVDWSLLDRRSPAVPLFFREAASFGIGPNGLTIPVRGPRGERSLFSVTSKLPRRAWSRLCAGNIHDLHILAYYLHEKMLTVTALRAGGNYRPLSRREQQCLELVARGRMPKQIAAMLGISESSVRLYLRTAKHKLDASTSHHAVARASFLELIRV